MARSNYYIKEWCEAKGISQARLVDLIDVEKSSISRWWTGKIRPEYENLEKIASAIGVPPYRLAFEPEISPLLDVWERIPADQKARARAMLEAFFQEDSSRNSGSSDLIADLASKLDEQQTLIDQMGLKIVEQKKLLDRLRKAVSGDPSKVRRMLTPQSSKSGRQV